jgi:uncharacterized phiE125 gp8 family phage protein
VEEVKSHLKIDGSDDDTILNGFIKQAREYCEGYQNKRYITQTLEMSLDRFPSANYIEFRDCSPVHSITSIKYTDKDGVESTFDAENYILDDVSFVNKVVLAYGKTWPDVTLLPVNGVKIQFIAGYGVTADKVPETVKIAMVLHIRLHYDDMRPEEKAKIEQARDALLGTNRVVPV